MPIITPSDAVRPMLTHAQFALGLTQAAFGELLGISRRTASRWASGEASPHAVQLEALARHVYPRDAELARQIAGEAGTTLEALGLVVPQAPPPPPPVMLVQAPPPPPPRSFPAPELLAESVVCAAAEALESPPAAGAPLLERVRHVLRAAFGRAQAMGLTVDEVHAGLRPRTAAAREPATPAKDATTRTPLRSSPGETPSPHRGR